jgi:hypothetical protein
MSAQTCPIHNKPMRPSRHGSGWYCPTKRDDNSWCDGETAEPTHRCEECGALLYSDYCRNCRDDAMIVALPSGTPSPAPVRQDGLDEDHYGHG